MDKMEGYDIGKKVKIYIRNLIVVALSGFGIYVFLSMPKKPRIKVGKKKVACIGDSITFGAGVVWTRGADSYPARLQSMLGGEYQVLNYGASGRTLQDTGDSPYKKTGFLKEVTKSCPEYIIICLGTNDSKPYNWNARKYEEQYFELVRHFQSMDNKPEIYVTTAPAAFVATGKKNVMFDIDADVVKKEIREIVIRVLQQTGVNLVDMYAVTEGHPEYFKDGVHPNKAGNRAFAKAVFQAIKKNRINNS